MTKISKEESDSLTVTFGALALTFLVLGLTVGFTFFIIGLAFGLTAFLYHRAHTDEEA